MIFGIEIYGDEILERELMAAAERVNDPMPVWSAIGEKLEEIEREQFETQGARAGNRWAQLDHKYMAWKFTHDLSIETLKATEDMYESLTQKTANSIRFATQSTYEFGSTTEQFGIQQDPPDDANFRIRYPIDLTEIDRLQMANMLTNYFVSGDFSISASGRRYYSKSGPGGRFVKRTP